MSDTPGFDKTSNGLVEFRHEVWEGFVYVNLDGNARSTRDLWGPLSQHLAPYRLGDWRVVSSVDWGECPWDWKVFMDNGECYHHLGIHRNTLEPIFPARAVRDLPDNGEFTCLLAPRTVGPTSTSFGVLTAAVRRLMGIAPSTAAQLAARIARSLTDHQQRRLSLVGADALRTDEPAPGLGAELRSALVLAYPFPNYALALLADGAFWYEVHPVAAGRITLNTHLLLPPHLATGPRLHERIAYNEAAFRIAHQEDVVVCEAVQRCASADAAQPGYLSHLEQHNLTFARWYTTNIGSDDPQRRGDSGKVFGARRDRVTS